MCFYWYTVYVLVKMKLHPRITEQDNQQERLVSDDYLAGFVEGEGCFYIGIVRSHETNSKWQVVYFFKVSQNPTGRLVLEELRKRLACGYIKANSRLDKSDKSLAYVVRDLPNLVSKVIPFFKGKLLTKKAEDYISSVIKKFIRENIVKDGSFFLIHFDSLSQEQSILMRQWKRVFPAFANIEEQSPSKQIIDKTLLELDAKGEITLSINHLQGDAIHYKSEDEVLETFMNFHLETYFNNLPFTESVIDDIKEQISEYRNEDGSYDITPGCYVYFFIKN